MWPIISQNARFVLYINIKQGNKKPYLDFVRTVLKTKRKQHWNLWDFHKTIYWYLGIKKFKKCWEIKISEDIFEDILQTILLIKDG